jgi:hypothetical protein
VGEVEGAGDVVVLAVTDGAGEVLALDDREADADGAAAEGVTLGLLVDPTVKSMLGNCTEARHGTVPSWWQEVPVEALYVDYVWVSVGNAMIKAKQSGSGSDAKQNEQTKDKLTA